MLGPLAIERLRFPMDRLLEEVEKKWVDCYRKLSDRSVTHLGIVLTKD